MTPKIWDAPSKEAAKQGGIGLQELQGSRLFAGRRYAEEHKLEITGADLLTCDGGDPRPKLYGMRATLGDCLCIPKRDREKKIRTWVGRRIHTEPVDQVAGDYEHGEALPPGHQNNPKYVYLPKIRRDSAGGESTVKEEKFYPLLLSPNFLDEESKAPIWICEGVIDAMLADQAGAAAIGMDGAYAYLEKVEELFRVLSGPAKQHREIYLCFDLDPARADAGKELELGPGQRGACMLLADLISRSHLLARKIKVVSLPKREDGGKVDLGDVLAAASSSGPWPGDDAELGDRLAYDRAVADSQRARLAELGAKAVDFWIHMEDQLPAEVAVRDRGTAIREVGFGAVAAHDPDLWAEIGPRIADRLGIPKKEQKSWLRSVVKSASEEAERDLKASDEDPLAKYRMKDGSVRPCWKSALEILKMEFGSSLRWDEMSLAPVIETTTDKNVLRRKVDMRERSRIRSMLADKYGSDVFKSDLEDAIASLAVEHPVHPVRQWLRALPRWDGIDRTPELMATLGVSLARGYAPDKIALYTTEVRKTLIAAVARAMEPGCQVDTMLVLQGDQGVRKSSFFRALAPQIEWWGSFGRVDPSEKDGLLIIHKKWILEVAEVDRKSFFSSAAEWKDLITTPIDSLRPPYMREVEDYPRSSIFVGSTNAEQFLTDPTGARRFWVIPLTLKKSKGETIDATKIEAIRDQVWAQALAAYDAWLNARRPKEACPWWLDSEEEGAHTADVSRHNVDDLEQDKVAAWLAQQPSKRVTGVAVAEGIGITRPSSGDGRRISRHMAALGWTRQHSREGTAYVAPDGWAPTGGLEVLEGGAGQLSLGADFLD